MAARTVDRDGEARLALVTWSQRTLSTLTLPPSLSLEARTRDLLREVTQWEALDRDGVPRRQRLILHGPPSCGKTSVASSLARALGIPLATVLVERIMSSYRGETGGNLRRVFDCAAHERVVSLLDEFDAAGKERDGPSDHRRLRRVVNAVLQQPVRGLGDQGSKANAGGLVRRLGGIGEVARDFAYRLYAICERRGWANDALGFNTLVTSWPENARRAPSPAPVQPEVA